MDGRGMPMAFEPLPSFAAWRHVESRLGLEVAFLEREQGCHRLHGCTTAVEDGGGWIVDYDIACDELWRTRRVQVVGRASAGRQAVSLDADGLGSWWIDGRLVPELDGCLDVDLESSALTNTLLLHRCLLSGSDRESNDAAYVRADGLGVQRLEQSYGPLTGDGTSWRCLYTAPQFDFSAELELDLSGLVVDYPGIARRVG